MKVYGKMEMRGPFWVQRANLSSDVSWLNTRVGRLLYAKITDTLWYCGNSTWIEVGGSTSLINANQVMIFVSWPLPDNWTMRTTNINERMVILDANPGNAASIGGSWFLSGFGNNNVTHNHYAPGGIGASSNSTSLGKSDRDDYQSKPDHRHYLSNSVSHTHTFDGSWRPASMFAIAGVYNGG